MNAHSHARLWAASHRHKLASASARSPLALMLGLSLSIHLLGLAIWHHLQPTTTRPTLPLADLAIHLQYSPAKTTLETPRLVLKLATTAISRPDPKPARMRTKPAKARQSIVKPKATAKIAQIELAKTARAKKTTTIFPLSPTINRKLAKNSTSRINLSRVISRLQQDLKQYFYYPRLARRKNIQGAVILGFAINRQGKINNVRIVKSSGFAILDIAAEDALRQLDQLHWEQDYLQRNNQHIELPVIYQLTES